MGCLQGHEPYQRYNAYRYLADFASVERWWTLLDSTPIPGEHGMPCETDVIGLVTCRDKYSTVHRTW